MSCQSATENGDENRLKKIEEERELDPVSAIRGVSLTTRASSLASHHNIVSPLPTKTKIWS